MAASNAEQPAKRHRVYEEWQGNEVRRWCPLLPGAGRDYCFARARQVSTALGGIRLR